MVAHLRPVVLCGGSGTRLWPLSRMGFPKQFLSLAGKETLFQQAVSRLHNLMDDNIQVGDALVVCNEEHRFMVLEQLRELQQTASHSDTLLLEPVGRNTAPALTLAALQASTDGDDPVLVVTPSDHTVADIQAFTSALRQSVLAAASGAVITLGVTPDRPETGYGYIEYDRQTDEDGSCALKRFVEKPDHETASRWFDEGGFAWNSGIFVLKASVWLAALQEFRPDIYSAVQVAWNGQETDGSFVRPDADKFAQIPSQSIDYAVMERCPGSRFVMRMVPLDAGWNDLGAWDAVWQVNAHNEQGNACRGDVLLDGAQNNLVYAQSRLVAVLGVENLVVVETSDAVLISTREKSQRVKQLVERLREEQRSEQNLHRKVYRPWGWYDSIDVGERFKVKRILVKPGASLSLQKHFHRAEHWVVVRGTAAITRGEKVFTISENQSAYIPLGETHRLSNPGSIPLEVIEVQSGAYLGEDDIVRISDDYART